MRAPLLLLLSLALAACHGPPEPPPRVDPTPPPVAAKPAPPPSEPPAPPPPATVERVRVPGDRAASVVRAADGSAPRTVFLPGVCSNANAYLQGFREAARRQGGVVAIEGDQPCGNLQGFHTFSWDAAKIHARIEAALVAAGTTEIPAGGIVLVGYSQGAALGEQLAQRWPERYTELVLIGAPTDPVPAHFARARGVVTMACSRDVTARMKEAAAGVARSGVPSTYVEMPGCTHGNLADGDARFDAVFDFLRERARPPRTEAASIPLVGQIVDDG